MTDLPFFLRDFDDEIAAEDAQRAAAVERLPTPEEIEARISEAARRAFEEGRAQGLETGLAQARAEAASLQAEALAQLVDPLGALLAGQRDHAAAVEADLGGFLVGLCEKTAPELIRRLGPKRLEAEARAIARRAQGSRRLEIRVAPQNVEAVTAILNDLAGDPGTRELRVTGDAALGPAAISARWHKGRSDHDYARLCQDLAAAIVETFPAEPAGT